MGPRLAAKFVRVRAVVALCVRPGVRSAALEGPTGAVDDRFDCVTYPPGGIWLTVVKVQRAVEFCTLSRGEASTYSPAARACGDFDRRGGA